MAIVEAGVSLEVTVSRTAKDTVGLSKDTSGMLAALLLYADSETGTQRRRISHISLKAMYDDFSEIIIDLGNNSKAKGFSSFAKAGAFLYLLEGGDIERIKSFRSFLRYGVSSNMSKALIYFGAKVMRNENHFLRTVDCLCMSYKAFNDDDTIRQIRVTEDEKKKIREKAISIAEKYGMKN